MNFSSAIFSFSPDAFGIRQAAFRRPARVRQCRRQFAIFQSSFPNCYLRAICSSGTLPVLPSNHFRSWVQGTGLVAGAKLRIVLFLWEEMGLHGRVVVKAQRGRIGGIEIVRVEKAGGHPGVSGRFQVDIPVAHHDAFR